MAGYLQDTRRQLPEFGLADRPMLEAWLDFHRTTLLMKCEGLTDSQRQTQPVPTSVLSLHGLVRHMAEVERNWFQRVLLRDQDTPWIWLDTAVPDSEMTPLDHADWDADRQAFEAECESSRKTAAAHELHDAGALKDGTPVTLRWIYTHMIEEYARHNGHADLIREFIDGAVGC